MAAPVTQLDKIVVGGPCSITDGGTTQVMFSEGDVVLEPQPTWREIPSDAGGDHDSVLIDLTWKVSFTPKSIVAYAATLVPTAYTNWTTAGARLIGSANTYAGNTLEIIGADGSVYKLTRACVTKMPDIFCGVGKSMWGSVEYTAFVGQGKALNASDAFWTLPADAYSQAAYSNVQQESICTAAWGAVAGFTTLWAEDGFQISHEFKTTPVKHGNVTIDNRINSYRAICLFKPQQPTETQLLANLQFGQTGTGIGVGTRMSTLGQTLTITDGAAAANGLKVIMPGMGFQRGRFLFSSKLTRLQDWALMTAIGTPGTRLTVGTN